MSELMCGVSYANECEQVMELVFGTMFGLAIERYDFENVPEDGWLTAAIYFAGSWYGAMLLECTRPQAYAITERLMSIPRPATLDDDVRDSLGEAINMIGGNMKAVLPRGAVLSMPSVIEGREYAISLRRAQTINRLMFSVLGEPLRLTLLSMQPPEGSGS